MRFYSNRELAQRLNLPLARWKRWSREFLPPDPLGGLQSGYARQYNLRDAFTVYLGGHLVADHGFSIPETRILLNLLGPWMRRHLLPLADRPTQAAAAASEEGDPPRYHLMITPARDLAGRRGEMGCRVQTVVSRECLDAAGGLWRLNYREISLAKSATDGATEVTVKGVQLSALFAWFLTCLNRSTGS